MEMDRAEKPLRQMRKLLKRMGEDPVPEEVHRLRTRARRIEAMAGALSTVDKQAAKRLLKAIKPIRKAAGTVRDMDVLSGNLLGIPKNGNRESLVKLEEHLGEIRRAGAEKLMDTVNAQRRKARKRLKNYARVLESAAAGKKPVARAAAPAMDSPPDRESRADELVEELTRWPALRHDNLHAFRLKVKELRYVLQLFPQAGKGFIDALAKVKDQIGAWHDWEQLLAIAREALDRQADRELLQHVEATSRRKLMQALAGANGLRQRYLSYPAQEWKRA